ncbi:MAG: hypothetical protein CL955_06325 [Erythrobacteraceae bacterium]|nr:hypothetical protein [Erythrobacteraceae bacterium]
MTHSRLFEPASPMPFSSLAPWIEGVLFGQVAVSLCVIAVALIGLMMASGRLPLRESARVVLGCCVLLGAPTIAASLMHFGGEPTGRVPVAFETDRFEPRRELPPPGSSPYSRAAVAKER